MIVHVLSEGTPAQESEMAELNAPPTGATVILVVAVPPALTDREELAGESEKSVTTTCALEGEVPATKLASPL